MLFNPAGLKTFLEDHIAGHTNNAYGLWALLIFAVWNQDRLGA